MTRDVDTAESAQLLADRWLGPPQGLGGAAHAARAYRGDEAAQGEDILDCSLLRRIASGIVVTPEGEALLPLAERTLALNDEAQAHVRSRAGRGGGRRRIGL